MGKHAKYHSEEERKVARAQRGRSSARKKEYDVEYQRRKRRQRNSQQSVARSLNDEVQGSISAELDGNISQLEGVTTVTEERLVAEMYHNSEAWGGISTVSGGDFSNDTDEEGFGFNDGFDEVHHEIEECNNDINEHEIDNQEMRRGESCPISDTNEVRTLK